MQTETFNESDSLTYKQRIIQDITWFGLVWFGLWYINNCWLFNAKSIFIPWRNRLLQHSSWSTARRHTSTIPLNICLDYVLRTSIDKIKEKGFQQTKKRSRTYPAKIITDAYYANDVAIRANILALAETLLHSLKRATVGIGLHFNAHKTEYMCFNQTGDISTLGGSSLKLVDKFTYLGSTVSSIDKEIESRLTKT